ncbi:wax ester/triacylglycerol synthase family O-acyltransferase [Patulibacter brassicae]|jgi:WS/DGAT/MGAT family acyltransferase|uniref:Diacylglycerol O-acyltransferase n=1 Tax=Patulibacter brassicae TaxID=1705717 RepID=A0ABU4VPE3_9ACTN|nr:wax ester/triacylglycerol synthase family O-acyltransferase [Patulibacter brassicae]MDX8153730.1 wax ester/triacylglycerol synthase family O-acyltransferase [Patulibacter brassicae]
MVRRLNAFDAQFLAAESGNTYGHYCGLIVCGPREDGSSVSREDVVALVTERIDRLPVLRWRLAPAPLGIAHPVVVDGPVEIDEHVTEERVDAPGDGRAIAGVIERMLVERMDRSRPLWELRVVHGLAEGRTAIVAALHHAVADGLSAGYVFATLQDPAPDAPSGEVVPRAAPGRPALLAGAVASAVAHPVGALRRARRTLANLDQTPTLRSFPGVRALSLGARRRAGRDGASSEYVQAPRTRLNGPLSPERRVAFETFPFAEVRRIKTAHGVTINDVVVALIAGALRRRLSATGDLPDEPLVAFIPVSVRPVQELTAFGNQFSSFIVPLPTDRATPLERLRGAHEAMAQAKARHRDVPDTLLPDANGLIPPVLFGPVSSAAVRLLGSGALAPPMNLLLSNVPGPPMPLTMAGAPVVAQLPMSLVLDGVGLNITAVSYAQDLAVGAVADAEALPDAWDLMTDLQAELDELSATVDAVGG